MLLRVWGFLFPEFGGEGLEQNQKAGREPLISYLFVTLTLPEQASL